MTGITEIAAGWIPFDGHRRTGGGRERRTGRSVKDPRAPRQRNGHPRQERSGEAPNNGQISGRRGTKYEPGKGRCKYRQISKSAEVGSTAGLLAPPKALDEG